MTPAHTLVSIGVSGWLTFVAKKTGERMRRKPREHAGVFIAKIAEHRQTWSVNEATASFQILPCSK
jgi:hypothetical protein